MSGVRRALGRTDGLITLLCLVLFVLHFVFTGLLSHLLSPWLIGSVLAGWLFARIALERIERS